MNKKYPIIKGFKRKPSKDRDGSMGYGRPCVICGKGTCGEKWVQFNFMRGDDETVRLCADHWNEDHDNIIKHMIHKYRVSGDHDEVKSAVMAIISKALDDGVVKEQVNSGGTFDFVFILKCGNYGNAYSSMQKKGTIGLMKEMIRMASKITTVFSTESTNENDPETDEDDNNIDNEKNGGTLH